MDAGAMARMRMHGLRLWEPPLRSPAQVVHDLVAMQAQEYAYARWSVAQRTADAGEDAVERALARGSILRTHVLRPTWHLVAAADLRWLLALTGPRVKARNGPRHRQLGLDERTFSRCAGIMREALAEGNHLTRRELAAVLARRGVDTTGQRLPYLLMHAELDQVICSGRRSGKHQTYALVDERAPRAKERSPDDALAELVRRYFTSRGPATVNDFTWWSGLTVADARRGIEMVGNRLGERVVDGRRYWHAAKVEDFDDPPTGVVDLVQVYDEVVVSYRESRDVLEGTSRALQGGAMMHPVLVNGRLAGRWRRSVGPRAVALEVALPGAGERRVREGLEQAAARYERFAGVPVRLDVTGRR